MSTNPGNLFQHVRKLEGVRHPLVDFDALDQARVYVINQFESMGYQVKLHAFQLEGFEKPFYNIEAHIPNPSEKYFLVTSHYDTVLSSPGASDNASAVAIMLEVARLLKSTEIAGRVRYVCFTLEEDNPAHQKQSLELGRDLGLLDSTYKPKTYDFYKNQEIFLRKLLENRFKGSESIFDDTLSQMTYLTEEEIEFFKITFGPYQKISSDYTLFALLGSSKYVESINKNNIIGLINFDPIGFTNKAPNTQRILESMDPSVMPKYKTSEDLSVADFALIISEKNSQHLAQIYFESAKEVDLSSVWLHVPLDYTQISVAMPDVLRSDHNPFWRQNIPGLFISDTANFRNPNYHCEGDTFDTLDYDFMTQVGQSTVIFLLKYIKSLS